MQLYVLDRAKNTLATTSSFYNDKHHKELTAGASIFEFTIDKSDSAAQYMTTGNYLVFLDDRGRAWSFTILSYDETQTTKTVAAEDVSIELLNKAMDVWNTDQAYPFSYYFDLVTKGTPWTLGVNQLTDLSRKLVYTGRDTGLGRLLSILKGFDNAECQFNIKVQQNKPVEFVVDVYKSIGTVQDNIQIVYNNELNDIKKTESRAQFVTALAGVGGLVENQATTDPGLEKHIDFTDIDYKDDNFVSPKGDKFLRAVTANKTFNPGTTTYIEDFYDYDTQSAQELLNRTLTQLKERSEPQYTYEADVKVIDPTLDIGDTVTIIDHDYNPALYLQARVATLDKSYTDPTQGAITFCNYRVLNSNLSDQLRAMQNIIDQLPTSASIKVINNNIVQMITQNEELKKQVALSFESANGKSRVWFSRSSTAQNGDIAFIKNADGATEIWKFVEGVWTLDTGLATFEDVKKAASAAADAGSQAVVAGQQASAAGADAKSAGDFAASAASQSTIETAAAKSAANSAVDQANLAISQAGFANDAADQAKSAAASAKSDAAGALAEATKSFNDAQNAVSNATKAMDAAEQNHTTVTGLVTKVDDITGTIQTLATTQSVDKLAGTVTTVQNLAQFASDGLKLKADTTTVNQINGTVNDLKGELDVQADKIAATVTASDVTGMLNGYATQSWSEGKISAAKNEISASVETVQTQVDNMQIGGRNLVSGTDQEYVMGYGIPDTSWKDGYAYIKLPTNATSSEILPIDQNNFWHTLTQGVTYTQTIWFETDATVKDLSAAQITWFTWARHDYQPAIVKKLGQNSYKVVSTYTWPGKTNNNNVRLFDIVNLNSAFDLSTGTYLKFGKLKLEEGNVATDWSPAPEDMATVDWTKAQLDIKDTKISAAVTSLKSDITNATAGMATQTWTQGKLDLTANTLTSQISSVQTNLDNMQVGGTNLITGTSGPFVMCNGIPDTAWDTTNQVSGISLPVTTTAPEVLPQGAGFSYTYMPGVTYTQSIYISTDAPLTGTPISFTWFTNKYGHDTRGSDNLVKVSTNVYRATSTYTWPSSNSPADNSRNADLYNLTQVFDFTKGTFLKFYKPKLEHGDKATDWSPAPEDMATAVQFTSIEQTLKGVQVTANNAVTQSQLTQTAGSLTSTIDNMQVGGRNLYLNSKAVADAYGINQGAKVTVEPFDDTTNMWHIVSGQGNGDRVGIYLYNYGNGKMPNSSDWAYSADVKGTVKATWFGIEDGNHKPIVGTVGSEWSRISQTGHFDNTGIKTIVIYFDSTDSPVDVYIKLPKLEIGNMPTDWSPAPEDQATVADVSSQITQLQNDINLRVKTGDLISQIDVNAKRILLDGASTYITNTTHIDTGVIKTAMIADAAITNGKIANAAIDNAKIANAAITAAKIADLAVGSAQIADGAISSAKIGNASITSAKIADASIIDAKIVNLDGSKIVANSITADKLDVNAIAVGLNTYGAGWQITPASIAFLPAGTTHTTIALSGDMGITYGDFTTGEILGHTYGTPYNVKAGKDWFNGISTVLKYNGADYWAVLTEESDSTVRPRLTYSRRKLAELGVYEGWTFDASINATYNLSVRGDLSASALHSTDSGDGVWLKRGTVGGHTGFGFLNARQQSGVYFTDDGTLYLGRAGRWYNLFDIVNKIGIA